MSRRVFGPDGPNEEPEDSASTATSELTSELTSESTLWSGRVRPPSPAMAAMRYRLEETLHDGPVSETSALAMELGALAETATDGDTARRLTAARQRIAGISDALREIGTTIYPPVLATGSLEEGLRSVAETKGVRLALDLPRADLSREPCRRVGLFVTDHLRTLAPGAVVRVRVRGRRLVRVRIADHALGESRWRTRHALLRCRD